MKFVVKVKWWWKGIRSFGDWARYVNELEGKANA